MWNKHQVFIDWKFGEVHMKPEFLWNQQLVFDLPFTADHPCIGVPSSLSPFHVNPKQRTLASSLRVQKSK